MNIEAMSHYASLKFSICNKFDIYVEWNMLNVEESLRTRAPLSFCLVPVISKIQICITGAIFRVSLSHFMIIRPDLSSLPCKEAIAQTYCTTTDRGGR